MRIALVIALAIIVTACVQRPAPVAPLQPAPVAAPAPVATAPKVELAKPEPPKNFVCEAFKGVNDKVTCTPYVTAGMHTAMMNLGDGQQLHCKYTENGVECHAPITIVQSPPAPVQDKKPSAPAKKK